MDSASSCPVNISSIEPGSVKTTARWAESMSCEIACPAPDATYSTTTEPVSVTVFSFSPVVNSSRSHENQTVASGASNGGIRPSRGGSMMSVGSAA